LFKPRFGGVFCACTLLTSGILPYNLSATEEPLMSESAATLTPKPKAATARLEARISADLQLSIKRAAELQGRTITDFVVAAVQEAASKAIEQAEVMRLSVSAQEAFAQALMAPPPPNAALKRAFAKQAGLMGE
jgi:uncharacterized protein (DUF1778 family)